MSGKVKGYYVAEEEKAMAALREARMEENILKESIGSSNKLGIVS
jgi:hypothetical protein